MGLDQNWVVKSVNWENIHYHRKFNALQGFFEEEWRNAGNTKEFNCELIPITTEMLDRLEEKVNTDTLEPVGGFFYGSLDKNPYYQEDVKELKTVVIPDVRERLKNGEEIAYTCWY